MSSSVELVRDALAWIASQWDENRVYIRSVTGGREHVLVELMASDGSYWAISLRGLTVGGWSRLTIMAMSLSRSMCGGRWWSVAFRFEGCPSFTAAVVGVGELSGSLNESDPAHRWAVAGS